MKDLQKSVLYQEGYEAPKPKPNKFLAFLKKLFSKIKLR
jgi:hypothetical protein